MENKAINQENDSARKKAERIHALLSEDGRFTSEEADKLALFSELVLRKNEVMNLTAITEPEAFYVKHLLDSLSLLPLLDDYAPAEGPCRLLDIGSGAGFPGVPIKIMRPETEILLLDSLKKRCRFLEELISALKADKITALHSRAEDAARRKTLRESFDLVTARAVASLPVLLELALPFLRTGGCFLAMKSNDEELASAGKALKLLNGEYIASRRLSLPGDQGERVILVFRKTGAVPGRFPRKAGTPGRKPLI